MFSKCILWANFLNAGTNWYLHLFLLFATGKEKIFSTDFSCTHKFWCCKPFHLSSHKAFLYALSSKTTVNNRKTYSWTGRQRQRWCVPLRRKLCLWFQGNEKTTTLLVCPPSVGGLTPVVVSILKNFLPLWVFIVFFVLLIELYRKVKARKLNFKR